MDLFDYMRENQLKQEAPLASRLRPRTLDEIVGQKDILGKDKLLYRAIQADKLSSLIFYGPPGTGKTTIARVIAIPQRRILPSLMLQWPEKRIWRPWYPGQKIIWECTGARRSCLWTRFTVSIRGSRIICFPSWRTATLILIGATTENPYFEVNGALLSRSVIFELKPLDKEDILELIHRAVTDRRGAWAHTRQR